MKGIAQATRKVTVACALSVALLSADAVAQPLELMQLSQGGQAQPRPLPPAGDTSSGQRRVVPRTQRGARPPSPILSRNPPAADPAAKRSRRIQQTRAPGNSPLRPSGAYRPDRRIVGSGIDALLQAAAQPAAILPGRDAIGVKPAIDSSGDKPNAGIEASTKPITVLPGKPAQCDISNAAREKMEALVIRFCAKNSASLEQARMAWQTNELAEMHKKIIEASGQLDKKIMELKSLREEIVKLREQQNEKVVSIFSEMRPDAAAQQLTSMTQDDATGILAAMSPKVASLILNEMPAKQAASLSAAMLASKSRGKP